MIILEITAAAIILSMIDLRGLKGKGRTRDIIVYTGCMLVAVGISIWYTLIMNKTSVADIFIHFLNLEE